MIFRDAILCHIIQGHTREAGVRSLSRALAALCRHVAVHIVSAADDAEGGGSAALIAGRSPGGAPAVRHEEEGHVAAPMLQQAECSLASSAGDAAQPCRHGVEVNTCAASAVVSSGAAQAPTDMPTAAEVHYRGHISSALATALVNQVLCWL